MLLRWLSRIYFRIIGWQIGDPFPEHIKKCVAVAAPHTSTLDYPIGLAAVYICGVKIRFLVKKEAFKWPFKFIFSGPGGIPVDRSKRSNTVDNMVQLFEESDDLILAIAPESTRSEVTYWKTGFYHIAMAAKVPIVLGYLDYGSKKAGFGAVIHPSGDIEKDLEEFRAFYKNIGAKNPEKFDIDSIALRPK